MSAPRPYRAAPLSRRSAARLVAVLAACAVGQMAGCSGGPSGEAGDSREADSQSLTLIACLGDSITYGTGIGQGREAKAWPGVLQRLLGNGCVVTNYGFPGATMTDGTGLSYRRMGKVEAALLANPAFVTLMLGTNDAHPVWWNAQAYMTALSETAEQIVSTPSVETLVLMAPPTAYEYMYGGPSPRAVSDAILADEVRPIIEEVAGTVGAIYIDLHAFTENRPDWFIDGIHPTSAAHAAIGRYIYERVWNGGAA